MNRELHQQIRKSPAIMKLATELMSATKLVNRLRVRISLCQRMNPQLVGLSIGQLIDSLEFNLRAFAALYFKYANDTTSLIVSKWVLDTPFSEFSASGVTILLGCMRIKLARAELDMDEAQLAYDQAWRTNLGRRPLKKGDAA